jgi:hypothetical protein
MMMPSSPRLVLTVIQSHLFLRLFIISFNTKAALCLSDQCPKRTAMRRLAGKPVFPRHFVPLESFDHKFIPWDLQRSALHQPIGGPNHHPSKTRRQKSLLPFPQSALLPTLRRQVFGDLTEASRQKKLLRVKAFSMNSSPLHRRLSRTRILHPSTQLCAHSNDVIQLLASKTLTKIMRIPRSGIGQYKTTLQAPFSCFVNQIECQSDFGLQSNLFRNPTLLPAEQNIKPPLRKIQCPIQRSA